MPHEFSGHIYIFHSFDIGDDIDISSIRKRKMVTRRPAHKPPYFRNYHAPLIAELPHPHATSHCETVKIHQFGVVTLRYKIPFTSTLEKLRSKINEIDNEYREQSVEDASTLYKTIKKAIKKPNFFHIHYSYLLIQVDVEEAISVETLQEHYGSMIASTLRFETERLSEYKKNEILRGAFGYYHGDLIITDTAASFIYDDEYEEVLDLFEFVTIQNLELQYFDQVLDKKLGIAYNRETQPLPFTAYMPMWGTFNMDRTSELGKLRVEISVITERLENSIRLTGEPYYTELYENLTKTLGIGTWKNSIEKKLAIIEDISSVAEAKIRTIREDLVNILIVILIFMELIVALLHLLHK